MIIILEGPDGGGKTTLARFLEKDFGFSYVHTGPPTDDRVLETYGRTLYDASRESGNVVIDRLHVGERIYGRILRGKDRLTRQGEVLIHRLTAAYGARLIFCVPPHETAFENWRRRHQDDEESELIKKEEVYHKVYDAYLRLRSDPFYNQATWYDYTIVPTDLAANVISRFGERPPRLPNGVIGHLGAKYLFVGEQANQEYLDIPFFALDGSSAFLNKCIVDAGYEERDLAFVNVLALDGSTMPLSAICAGLEPLVVIALGNVPARLLKSQGIKFEAVPHPAYWKRFHSSKRDEYVDTLRRIRLSSYNLQR